jgi:hypothetical protein
MIPYIFEKYSNVKFRENPSSGSRVIPCEVQDGKEDGHTDMRKLIVASRNLHALKNFASYVSAFDRNYLECWYFRSPARIMCHL